MRGAGALLLLFVLVAPPTGAVFTVAGNGVPAMRFIGDGSFSPLTGVTGSGTAEDPYVIENARFVLMPMEPLAVASLAGEGMAPAAIAFENTSAHVVVRGNTFVAAVQSPVLGYSTPATQVAIRVLGSSNITIENNTFIGAARSPAVSILTGGPFGSPARTSTNIVVSGNTFEEIIGLAIGAQADHLVVNDNTVHLYFQTYGGVSLAAHDLTAVRNDVEGSFHVSLDSSALIAYNVIREGELEIYGGVARGDILITHNTIGGALNLLGSVDDGPIRDGRVTRNLVDGRGGDCGRLSGAWASVDNNTFESCGGFSITLDAFTPWFGNTTILSGPDVDGSNTLNGGRILRVHDVTGGSPDLAEVSFLQAWNVSEALFAGANLTFESTLVNLSNVSVVDSSLGEVFIGGKDVNIDHVSAARLGLDGKGLQVRDVDVLSSVSFFLRGGLRASNLRVAAVPIDGRGTVSEITASGCNAADPPAFNVDNSTFFGGMRLMGWYCISQSGTIHDTSLAGPNAIGFYTDARDGTVFDARSNWWGSADGPRAEVRASGKFLYDPWLASPPSTIT